MEWQLVFLLITQTATITNAKVGGYVFICMAAFNRATVRTFFDKLEMVYGRTEFQTSQIFKVDVTVRKIVEKSQRVG